MFGLFKKKDSGAPAASTGRGVPTERVVSLSSQGMSEPEIIKTLREEGYSPMEVDGAMKGALRAGSGVPAPARAAQPPSPPPSPSAPAPQMPGAVTGEPTPERMGPSPSPPPPPTMPPEPPAGGQPTGFPQLPSDKYAPTQWEPEEELDDDFDRMPPEKGIGPDSFISRTEGGAAPKPPEKDFEPLPFARSPLPKGIDRERELKERRRREVEELTEEITEEKSKGLTERVQGLEEKLDRLSAEIKSGASHVGAGAPSKELDAIRKDVDSQKHGLEETNARIDSLEEVVKGSLAPMIESVRKFSSAVKAPSASATAAKPEEKK